MNRLRTMREYVDRLRTLGGIVFRSRSGSFIPKVILLGDDLPRAAHRYLLANVDVLLAAWRRLNP